MAEDICASEPEAAHFFVRNLLHTCRGNGDAQTHTHQAQNGEPVRGLLHNPWTEAALLAKARDFVPCVLTDIRREKNEGLGAEITDLNRLLCSQWMFCRNDGDIWLRQQDFRVQVFFRTRIARN